MKVALTDLHAKAICQRIYGVYSREQYRQMRAWLTGRKPMPVDVFWEIMRAHPWLDLARSLQDITDRRLMWKAKSAIIS